MLIFSLQKRSLSAFSGKSLFLSAVKISPAVENNLSTSVEVGGGVRYKTAKESSLFSYLLRGM